MRAISTLALLAIGGACGGGNGASKDYEDTGGSWAAADDYSESDGGWDTGNADANDTEDELPSESEDDFLAMLPSYTDTYVFIANPDRDTVTRVNVYTLQVDTAPVGRRPSAVETTPDYSTAVVFNEGDDTVTLVDADTLEMEVVDVRPDLNTLTLSPDGRWAGLYLDLDAVSEEDTGEGIAAFNEFSLVNIGKATHHAYAVGFNPTDVQYTPDGSLCVVVSDAYLAVFDLTGETPVLSSIPISEDTIDPPVAQEVIIAPDGSYAWVRQFGAESTLLLVDLQTGELQEVETGAGPTDLDLDPAGNFAVAVARGSNELWVYSVLEPDVVSEVLDLPAGLTFGSIEFDPTGEQALLYTTATATAAYASWDIATGEMTLHGLIKPVDTLSVTPSGGSMLVFHTKEDADDADEDDPWYGAWALTLVDLTDHRPNPMVLDSEPLGYAHSPEGELGYFVMDGEPYLELLDYQTLLHEEYRLKSNPVFVGVLPTLTPDERPPAYVSQEHELGRISFFHPEDETLETITGFELNSEIEVE